MIFSLTKFIVFALCMPGTEGKRKRESTPIKAKVSSTPETWFLDKRGTFAKMFPHLFLTGLGVATSLTAK